MSNATPQPQAQAVTPESVQQKITQIEAEFREVKEKEDYFREQAELAATQRQQLIGKAAALNDLLGELSPAPLEGVVHTAEEQPAPDAETPESEVD